MTRRNPDRYTAADWKFAGPTVGVILANRWLVYAECDLCELHPVNEKPVVGHRPTGIARLAWKQWSDPLPLRITQFVTPDTHHHLRKKRRPMNRAIRPT